MQEISTNFRESTIHQGISKKETEEMNLEQGNGGLWVKATVCIRGPSGVKKGTNTIGHDGYW